MDRTFVETHPWINFRLDLSQAPFSLWMKVGEAESKCEHIAGVALPPRIEKKLQAIYLSKGVHATTSIEGNTLTLKQVREAARGKLTLPRSQEYLAVEVNNVLDVCREIASQIESDEPVRITPELICEYNKRVLNGLDLADDVEPGLIRQYSVGVGTYRGAPWADCSHLLDRLCAWLNDELVPPDESLRFAFALFKAIVAHLYLAWIHPFGDGNGRTARLLEFLILTQAGVPLPAAHLLSNHYNKTRSRYYDELNRSSQGNVGPLPFVAYAIEGFVDGLTSQIKLIRGFQWSVAWENYIHERFRDKTTPAATRQKQLILELPPKLVSRSEIPLISPRVARNYASKNDKTLTRDLNTLITMKLLRKENGKYRPNRELILAFLPKRRGKQAKRPDGR